MKYKKVKARLMALSAAILVALSTNTGVRAASSERPSFSDVTQSQSYYADMKGATASCMTAPATIPAQMPQIRSQSAAV